MTETSASSAASAHVEVPSSRAWLIISLMPDPPPGSATLTTDGASSAQAEAPTGRAWLTITLLTDPRR